VSDQHLHHEQQWGTAMTSHWLHQLLTVGVGKYTIIQTKFQAIYSTEICVLGFCCISRSNGKTQWWYWLPLERHVLYLNRGPPPILRMGPKIMINHNMSMHDFSPLWTVCEGHHVSFFEPSNSRRCSSNSLRGTDMKTPPAFGQPDCSG
jgi:hypothetical protein